MNKAVSLGELMSSASVYNLALIDGVKSSIEDNYSVIYIDYDY